MWNFHCIFHHRIFHEHKSTFFSQSKHKMKQKRAKTCFQCDLELLFEASEEEEGNDSGIFVEEMIFIAFLSK